MDRTIQSCCDPNGRTLSRLKGTMFVFLGTLAQHRRECPSCACRPSGFPRDFTKCTHCCSAQFACVETSLVTLQPKCPSLDTLLSNQSCAPLPLVSLGDFIYGRQRFPPAVPQPLHEYFGWSQTQRQNELVATSFRLCCRLSRKFGCSQVT